MQYAVKAYRGTSGVTTVYVDAATVAQAEELAREQGFSVLSVSATRSRFRSAERFNVALFCQELLALLEAGLTLNEALGILQRKAGVNGSRVLATVHKSLGEGLPFSGALETATGSFPVLLVATVRSAERTGDLPAALKRYLAYQTQITAVRDRMISAAVYPALLSIVGFLVIVFLMVYVVPRFSLVYEEVGAERLPLLSRWLMNWGVYLSQHSGQVMLMAAAMLAAIVVAASLPSSRARLMRQLWSLPRVGEYLKIYQLAQFTRTIAMLLRGGIPLLRSLDMTAALLSQPALAAGLQSAKLAIAEGKSVSDAFSANGLATEVGVRLLVVGERTGDLAHIMERIAAFYDGEIARAVEWFSRLFEPILMVVIGLLIGGIVVLMYLPILELAGAIQ